MGKSLLRIRDVVGSLTVAPSSEYQQTAVTLTGAQTLSMYDLDPKVG